MSETNGKGLLTADDVEALLVADDLATVEVFVPEWKRTVRLRQLTAADSMIISASPARDGLILIVSMSVVDASGNRLFKEPERLKGKSAGALSRIQNEALKLNGFSTSEVAAAAAAAAAKNA